ncbi:hypothetical protein NEF87_003486 [Candidatus Lokiarchaeum ossiferum]|uniref:Response regulatory domain-containing protein n=1 Tax=Candidatus Lokiarchaeum ossiferum TaxID=2951803 RepID=A0ABY6HUJ6_9ARCH|nr:hypothetical protein NEF87_003486 [Candidatus Lokiarchaeum sp. B-35]
MDLFINDMIMPLMNGTELIEIIVKEKPDVLVLFISRYSEKILVELEIFKIGLKYRLKPFSQKDLLINIKEILASSQKKE